MSQIQLAVQSTHAYLVGTVYPWASSSLVHVPRDVEAHAARKQVCTQCFMFFMLHVRVNIKLTIDDDAKSLAFKLYWQILYGITLRHQNLSYIRHPQG